MLADGKDVEYHLELWSTTSNDQSLTYVKVYHSAC